MRFQLNPLRSRTPGQKAGKSSLRLRALAASALVTLGGMTAGTGFTEPKPYKTLCATNCSAVPTGSMQVQTQASPVKVQVLNLAKGRSAVVDLPVDASDVFVSNPTVADAVLRTPRRIFVLGVDAGQSDAIFFDQMGRQILNLSIRVDAPTDQLSDTMHRLFPDSRVDVQSMNGHVILSGMAQNDAQADQILRLAQTYVDDPTKVINLLSIAGKDQVTLKVRIVEINRSTIKQLGLASSMTSNASTRSYSFGRSNTYGVNGSALGGQGLCYGQNGARTTNVNNQTTVTGNNSTNNTSTNTTTVDNNTSSSQSFTANHIGSTVNDPNAYNADNSPRNTWSGTGATSDGSADPMATGSATKNSTDVSNVVVAGTVAATGTAINNVVSQAFSTITGMNNTTCLQAFERVGLARTLAEPNLTAISGESAKFLAGGEFPVPVGQDSQGRITIEFKPFGVGLGFTPIVMSGGRISMKISTEVSELTNTGAFQLNSTLAIPALNVRRAETSVEMQSGSSLMIAGLLQSKMKQTIDSLPGMTSLPVLGSLFRSRDFLNDETEMVVIVTPYIVDPTDPDSMQTPADGLETAHDASTVFMGRLNKVIHAKNGDTAPISDDYAPAYQAPIGYVIE